MRLGEDSEYESPIVRNTLQLLLMTSNLHLSKA